MVNRLLSYLAILTLQMLIVGCGLPIPSDIADATTRIPDLHTPPLELDRNDLQEYRIAYCWVKNDHEDSPNVRTDVVVESGDGSSYSIITYPTEPPTTPISLGCFGGDQGIRLGGYGLEWRPNHSQITMLGSANESSGDNFYYADLTDHLKEMIPASPIWDHESLFHDPTSLSWSLTGEWIATDGFDAVGTPFGANIWLYNPDTNDGRQLTDIKGSAPYMSNPSWSPDEQHISFTYGPKQSGIGIISLTGGNQIDITDQTQASIAPWRFDLGETINVYDNVIRISNSEALQHHLISNAKPQWIDNGKRVVFVAPTSEDRVTLFDIGVDGQGIRDILPNHQGLSTAPNISPNGQELAFVRYVGWNQRDRVEIAIYDVNSGEVRSLAVLPAPTNGDELYISGLDWSADGKYLAISSNHSGDSEIYVISSNGQSWTNLTKDRQGIAVNPVWSP